jgi:hypothetical protein
MLIKRLSAAFGRLHNDTLTLGDGLNIIQAPNESGKSTWCAFIKAMLYGVNTSERDKTGYLSVKTKYSPWSGAQMSGAMALEINGVAVTLQRSTDRKGPMKNFSAVLTGTGEPYPALSPDTAGETLTGASEDVFDRSAFVAQAGLRVEQTPELEKRITSLVSTGDETVSYTETDKRLREWLRKRRYKKIGAIPQLEEELADLHTKLSRIENELDEAAAARLERDRLKNRRDELAEELRRCQRYESLQKVRRARDKAEQLKAQYNNLYRELAKSGRAPTKDDLDAIRRDLKALEQLGVQRQGEQQRMTALKAAYEELLARKNASPFSGREGLRDVNDAAALERDIRQYDFKNTVSVFLLILTAVFIALAALLPAFRLAAAALALVGAALLVWRIAQRGGLRRRLEAILSQTGANSAEALRAQFEAFRVLSDDVAEAESVYRSADRSVFSAAENYRAVRNGLASKLEAAGLFGEPESAGREVARVESLLARLNDAEADAKRPKAF